MEDKEESYMFTLNCGKSGSVEAYREIGEKEGERAELRSNSGIEHFNWQIKTNHFICHYSPACYRD